jgi:hypothetical protein
MNGHCINIAISGISLKVSDELKIELRKTIPNEFGINWINISDPNLDLLLINENFLILKVSNVLFNKNNYHV